MLLLTHKMCNVCDVNFFRILRGIFEVCVGCVSGYDAMVRCAVQCRAAEILHGMKASATFV